MMRPITIILPIMVLCVSVDFASAEEQVSSDVYVTSDAFCKEKTGLNCNVFLNDGDEIRISELASDSTGKQIIHFHSVQMMEFDATIVHVWETDDDVSRPRAKLYVSDWAKSIAHNTLDIIMSSLERLELPAFAVVLRNGAGTSPKFRAYSQRIVHGPGTFTAYVTTINGDIIRESKKITITVVK